MFVTKKKLNKLIEAGVRARLLETKNREYESALYYEEILTENLKLKEKIEKQDILIKSMRIVRDFLNG